MSAPEVSPIAPLPEHAPQHRPLQPARPAGGDDELPPSARVSRSASRQAPTTGRDERRRVRRRWIKRGVVAAVLLAAVCLIPWTPREASHANWRHHDQASAHFADGDLPVKWVTDMGTATFLDGIVLGPDDIDVDTTTQLLRSRWNPDRENEILEQAQQGLEDAEAVYDGLAEKPDEPPARPTLSQGMRAEIANGDARCFHIFLYDSCVHDGDVVDIIIDGHRFATVPITKQGTTLSVPLSSQSQIAIRGVFDGGGGVTVACQTSQGDGFVRILQVGEEQILGVIGK